MLSTLKQTYGWNCCDDFSEFKFVKDRRFPGGVQPNYKKKKQKVGFVHQIKRKAISFNGTLKLSFKLQGFYSLFAYGVISAVTPYTVTRMTDTPHDRIISRF